MATEASFRQFLTNAWQVSTEELAALAKVWRERVPLIEAAIAKSRALVRCEMERMPGRAHVDAVEHSQICPGVELAAVVSRC